MWTLKCKYGKPGTVTPKSCWSLPATMSFQLWYLPLCNTWTRSYCPFWDPNLYHHIPKTPSPLCSYIFRMMQNKCNIDCFWIPADAFYAISCHTLILRSFIIHIWYHFWMFTKYNQLMEDRWTIYFVLTSPTTQSKINQLIIKTLVSNLSSRSNILIQSTYSFCSHWISTESPSRIQTIDWSLGTTFVLEHDSLGSTGGRCIVALDILRETEDGFTKSELLW